MIHALTSLDNTFKSKLFTSYILPSLNNLDTTLSENFLLLRTFLFLKFLKVKPPQDLSSRSQHITIRYIVASSILRFDKPERGRGQHKTKQQNLTNGL